MSNRRELADAIRVLGMDVMGGAGLRPSSMLMDMADVAQVLWSDYLRFNPANPHWPNRDRFVLSSGHGSMLQYALLHLAGFDLPLHQLKRFRQQHSKTAGHPDASDMWGIETTTTGPFGHGLVNAVGLALAEKMLGAQFNRPGHAIVNHRTYALLDDDCLTEGVSHEAASLAGSWQLGKLVAIYNDHGMSSDVEDGGRFADDIAARFEACGWRVIVNADGHDAGAVDAALKQATGQGDKPVLICARTMSGFGAPGAQDTEKSRGAAHRHEELAAARAQLGWKHSPFEIPDAIYAGWNAREAGARREQDWSQALDAYTQAHPELAAELRRRLAGELPLDWAAQSQAHIAQLQQDGPEVASGKASQMMLGALGPLLPELLGCSADPASSSLTQCKGSLAAAWDDGSVGRGSDVRYGMGEFGTSAIGIGMALHGGFIPCDTTSLVLSDASRSAVRMSALIPAHVIHVYTYDRVGLDSTDVNADGPAHQPVEHLAALRYIPNNRVWRPCDAVESAVSWAQAIERRDGPSCLVFSRQALSHQHRSDAQVAAIKRGGYVLLDPPAARFEAILIATGAEVELAMEAARTLAQQHVPVRVVSMPCTEAFDAQSLEYREGVLPLWCRARVAVEAAAADFWRKYVGLDGEVVGISSFGISASAPAPMEHSGFTITHVIDAVRRVIA